jgi:hypothetical protein
MSSRSGRVPVGSRGAGMEDDRVSPSMGRFHEDMREQQTHRAMHFSHPVVGADTAQSLSLIQIHGLEKAGAQDKVPRRMSTFVSLGEGGRGGGGRERERERERERRERERGREGGGGEGEGGKSTPHACVPTQHGLSP